MRRDLLPILLLTICACDDIGLGVPGIGTPLPEGGLPASQTLEGGAQIRVSQSGFNKLMSVVPGIVNDEVSQGMCIPRLSILGNDVCILNQGGCTLGCFIAMDLAELPSGLTISIPDAHTVHLHLDASATGSIRIDNPLLPACTVSLSIASLLADVDVGVSIDQATGVFTTVLETIDSLSMSGVSISGCSSIPNRNAILSEFLEVLISTWVIDAVTPAVNAAIGELVPAQTEIAALVDLPALALTGLSASTGSAVETRVVPGGYVSLGNNGLSLGVVTGFNSDADPQTRSAGLVSEPDACVAGLTAPVLSQPPFSFPMTPRGSFSLPPADVFSGSPEPADDLLVGVSQSALDLAGHHMVASGGMCLTLDASRAAFVRRDMLDDLLGVPLGEFDEELRFVVRPQQPIRFTLGTGSVLSPHLRAHLDDLEIDVETLPGGTATPALRLAADVAIGSQLGTRREAGLPTRLETTRSALDVTNPAVEVFDARYAGLNATDLDVLAGTIVDVVFSTIGAGAGTVLASDFAGFGLDNVIVERVTTAGDDFLAVRASLGVNPSGGNPPAPTPQPLSTTLVLPTPAELRAALLAGDSADLPTLHVELPIIDGSARPLEHAWRTAGGVWRPYEATNDLVVRDRSFAWQGERTIELRSRVVGDDSTTSPVGSTTVWIDYAPPTIFADQVTFSTHLVVPARDTLSTTLEWAMGPVGENTPTTAWSTGPNLDAATALAFGDEVVVYVRDDVGNVAQSPPIPLPEPGVATATGLACSLLVFMARRARRTQPTAVDSDGSGEGGQLPFRFKSGEMALVSGRQRRAA